MKDSTDKFIQSLNMKIKIRDDRIKAITRENEVQSIIIKNQKKKYKLVVLMCSILTLVCLAFAIYELIVK
jgi:hypothetical protein